MQSGVLRPSEQAAACLTGEEVGRCCALEVCIFRATRAEIDREAAFDLSVVCFGPMMMLRQGF